MWLYEEDEANDDEDDKLVFDELTYDNVEFVFRIFEGQDVFKNEPDESMPKETWRRIKNAS